MNENEMTKRMRFRAMDLFLVMLVLFAVIGIARRAGAFRANAADTLRDYSVRAVWTDVDSRTVACLSKGETLYTNAGELFGTVLEVRSAPHKVVFRENGERVAAVYPPGTREDVYMTVAVRGGEHDGVILRENGKAILEGETYRLYSERASAVLTILSLSSEK